MTAKLYLSPDNIASPDVIELQTFFHEDLVFDVNHTKMQFASKDQVDDLSKRSMAKLREQKLKIQDWMNIDKSIDFDVFYDFTQTQTPQEQEDLFQVFKCDKNPHENDKLPQTPLSIGEWKVSELDNIREMSGCNLSQRMATLKSSINIRSKAFIMNANFILWGDSSLNFITRSKHNNEETTVIKFLKSGSGPEQRLFLYFGILDKPNKSIKYTKRTEIPVILTEYNQIKKDFLEVSCSIHDNGDQFLIVSGEVNHSSKYHFKAKYEQIIPYFEDFNVYIYGEKQTVVLKKLRLKLIPRKDLGKIKAEKVMHSKCCSIF